MIGSLIGTAAFYVFATVLIASAAMVITSKNPVYSVLFLVLAFFNAAGLFLLAGAEFLALILVIVYVGAVAVLFMFVVMMLDVNFAELRGGFQRYAPVGAAVGIVLLGELGFAYGGWRVSDAAPTLLASATPAGMTNTAALGQVLYTDYVLLFQLAGVILLVAMIGAIVLTLRDKKTSRKQNIQKQISRTVEDTLVMVPVALGQGVGVTGIKRPLPPKVKAGHDDHGHGHDEDDHGHGHDEDDHGHDSADHTHDEPAHAAHEDH